MADNLRPPDDEVAVQRKRGWEPLLTIEDEMMADDHPPPDDRDDLEKVLYELSAQVTTTADYPDTPEQAERRSRITKALYASQVESMAHLDDDERP